MGIVQIPRNVLPDRRWVVRVQTVKAQRRLANMLHRHLNHQRFTLAAIDDVISRGRWIDWFELRQAVLDDNSLLEKIEQVCRARVSDPYAQRHHFWMHYAKEHRAAP